MKKDTKLALLEHLRSRFSEKIHADGLTEADKIAVVLIDKLRNTFGGLVVYVPAGVAGNNLQYIFDNSKEEDLICIVCRETLSMFAETLQTDFCLPTKKASDLSFSLVNTFVSDCRSEIIYIPKGEKINEEERNRQIYTEFLKGKPLWKLANEFNRSVHRVYGIIKKERKKECMERAKILGTS